MGTSLCRRWYEPSSCIASCSTTPITCTTNSSLQFFPQPIVARRARATHQKPRRATKKGTYAPQYDSHSRRMSGVFPHQAHARGDIGDGPRAVARHGTHGAVPHAPRRIAAGGGRRRRGTRGPARSRERPCVTRGSVHRLAKITSRSRSGAFVYTVATLWTDVGTKECTQIGENGPSAPFRGIRVHCCVASRDASCVGWHERPNRHGVPAPSPRWPPLPCSVRQALRDRLCASGAACR